MHNNMHMYMHMYMYMLGSFKCCVDGAFTLVGDPFGHWWVPDRMHSPLSLRFWLVCLP